MGDYLLSRGLLLSLELLKLASLTFQFRLAQLRTSVVRFSDVPLLDRERRLHQTGNASCGFKVSDVGFERAQRAGLVARPAGEPGSRRLVARIPRERQGRPVPGQDLRFYPAGRDQAAAEGSDDGGLCLRRTYRCRQPLRGGKDRPLAGAGNRRLRAAARLRRHLLHRQRLRRNGARDGDPAADLSPGGPLAYLCGAERRLVPCVLDAGVAREICQRH